MDKARVEDRDGALANLERLVCPRREVKVWKKSDCGASCVLFSTSFTVKAKRNYHIKLEELNYKRNYHTAPSLINGDYFDLVVTCWPGSPVVTTVVTPHHHGLPVGTAPNLGSDATACFVSRIALRCPGEKFLNR